MRCHASADQCGHCSGDSCLTNYHSMKPLLDITHPKYLRRLAREIKAVLRNGVGVYVDSDGGNNVRVYSAVTDQEAKAIRVTSRTGGLKSEFLADPDKFIDGYGRSIVARRSQ